MTTAMKTSIILWSVWCVLLMGGTAPACTGLVVQDGEHVWVGNNEDWFNPRTKIWFIQPGNGRYGSVFFGFDNFWPQCGMNQKGLFFDAFALKPKAVDEPQTKPRFRGNLIKEVMATCGTVAEALALMERYSLSFMPHFQLFIADAPVIVVGCGHPNEAYDSMGGYGNSAEIDVAIAIDHLTLAAVQEGLGTCWIGAFDEAEVKQLLEIPPQVKVVAMTPLGYPASPELIAPLTDSDRKDPAEIFGDNRYA